MDSATHKRKPLLFSDLFKTHKSMGVEKAEENNTSVSSKCEGSIWSTSSNRSSSCDDSFLSDFGTPSYSDFPSYEEEDDGKEEDNRLVNDGDYAGNYAVNCNFGSGLYRNPVRVEYRTPPIQVYELKNQPSVSKQSPVLREKRVNRTESAQQYCHMQYRRTEWGIHHPVSGMQAVFLGGSGLKSGNPGTGVFLPRVTNDQTEIKQRSGGCSMVLMPTRVLQALDLHFNRLQDSSATPPLCGGSPNHICPPKDEPTESNRLENPAANHDDIQLPQEWTY